MITPKVLQQPRDTQGRFARITSLSPKAKKFYGSGWKAAKQLTQELDRATAHAIDNHLDRKAQRELEALGSKIESAQKHFGNSEILHQLFRGLESRHEKRLDAYHDSKAAKVEPQVKVAVDRIQTHALAGLQKAYDRAVANPNDEDLEEELTEAHSFAIELGKHLSEHDPEFHRSAGQKLKAVKSDIQFIRTHANEHQRDESGGAISSHAERLLEKYYSLPEPTKRSDRQIQELERREREQAQMKVRAKKQDPIHRADMLRRREKAINDRIYDLLRQYNKLPPAQAKPVYAEAKKLMKQRDRRS